MWVYDLSTKKMEYKEISYVPGLYKIFGKLVKALTFACR